MTHASIKPGGRPVGAASQAVTRGYVTSTPGQLHYRVAGSGTQTIVCLHQTASSSRMYERLMTELSSEFRLVALDTPGFGESDPWPSQPTTADFVEALATAVDNLGIDRYHVLGHHTGAALGCEMAATYPDRVLTLTMSGALVVPEKGDWWQRDDFQDQLGGSALEADGAHLLGAWHRAGIMDPEPVALPPDIELRHRETTDTIKASPRWPETYRAVFSQDFEGHLAAVACPVFIMCGQEDVLWPYFDATVAAKPGCRSLALPAGAYVMDQHAGLVADALRDFIGSTRTSN